MRWVGNLGRYDRKREGPTGDFPVIWSMYRSSVGSVGRSDLAHLPVTKGGSLGGGGRSVSGVGGLGAAGVL